MHSPCCKDVKQRGVTNHTGKDGELIRLQSEQEEKNDDRFEANQLPITLPFTKEAAAKLWLD
jgi:hypothetical protein